MFMSTIKDEEQKSIVGQLNIFLEQYRNKGFMPNIKNESARSKKILEKIESISEVSLDKGGSHINCWDNFWNQWADSVWTKSLWSTEISAKKDEEKLDVMSSLPKP